MICLQYENVHVMFASIPNYKEQFPFLTYSVMQWDENSFGGNVVLESVDMVFRGEGSILNEYTQTKYFRSF